MKYKTTSFSNLFPEVGYENTSLLNIWNAYQIVEKHVTDIKSYYNKLIENGDRWDTISYDAFEYPELWWAIALFNDVIDPFVAMESTEIVTKSENTGEAKAIKVLRSEYLMDILYELKKLSKQKIG